VQKNEYDFFEPELFLIILAFPKPKAYEKILHFIFNLSVSCKFNICTTG